MHPILKQYRLRPDHRSRLDWVIVALCLLAFCAKGFAATLNVSGGGTINLQSGVVYDQVIGLVPPYSALPNGTSIIGPPIDQPPAIIRYASNQGYAFKAVSPGATFRNVKFDRGGLYLEGDGTIRATVDNCVLAASVFMGPKLCGLQVAGTQAVDLRITNNLCSGTNGQFNIYSDTGGLRVVIANNDICFTTAGIHWTGEMIDFRVEQNYLHDVVAQGFEFQGSGRNNRFLDNWVQGHKLRLPIPGQDTNGSAYSYSLPLEKCSGTIIQRNVSIQPLRKDSPDKIGVRIIFELGGNGPAPGFTCTDNLSEGGNDVCAINGAAANGSVTRNCFASYDHATMNNGANGAHATIGFNGPNVVTIGADGLPLDLKARGPAGRNHRYGSPPPTPNPPPVIPPSTLPVPPSLLRITGGQIQMSPDGSGSGTITVAK